MTTTRTRPTQEVAMPVDTIIELERHQDRIDAGAESLKHLRSVVVTRSQHSMLESPMYRVWLSEGPNAVEGYTFLLTQTQRLGFAAQIAAAAADGDER